tara:strand:- start:9 stop:284 length:276 start_codon:yes stop_codon:yes gene_type:complete
MKKVDLKNKKEFYVTELHMGDDGLESTTDYGGPFTLSKCRRVLERMFKNPGAMVNPYSFSIRGPVREVEAVGGDHTYKSEWYPNKDKKDLE